MVSFEKLITVELDGGKICMFRDERGMGQRIDSWGTPALIEKEQGSAR